MLKVKIICIGKLKEKYLREAQAEYLKRLGAFCKAEVRELAEERLPDNPSEAQIKDALKKEAKKISAETPKGAYVYSLCIEGREISSEELAKRIESNSSASSSVVFIIGSSFGLDEELKANSSFKLSFSPMTFPHQLARVMLLEQVYRAFSINNNSKYHK